MKVLVVGGGGREHAICWKLAQSPKVTELYCAPGNGGIAQVAQCVPIKATDVEAMVAWAKEHSIDFVMVAPDDPLDFDTAHEIGLKFAKYFKGYQCVVVTHMNTAHIHNHIIMNSVNFETGMKFHQSA